MAKTDALNYNSAKKYAQDLWANCEGATDSRIKLGNRMIGLALLLGLETGARISDLLKMKFSDIEELPNRPNVYTITWDVAKSNSKHKWVISADMKSKIDATQEYMKLHHSYYGDLIFYNAIRKTRYSREWASKRIAVANRLGKMGQIIDVAGSHSLRKASAHNLYEKSKDLRLVQSLLKHRNIKTTNEYLGLREKEAFEQAICVLGY
tara:strand:+ start:993 stop:1616 length:624 start_codon:yes stop_codon:yes gene_type:complete